MELTAVEIKNYRSIDDLTIRFEPRCQILVGINESGKSNILNALSLLAPDVKPQPGDIRFEGNFDSLVTTAYVRFRLKLSEDEREWVYQEAQAQILDIDPPAPVLTFKGSNRNLKEYCYTREGVYSVDLIKKTKGGTYWALSDDYEVAPIWKKPIASCPAEQMITDSTGRNVQLASLKAIHQSLVASIPPTYLEEVTKSDISRLVGEHLIALVKSQLPECIYWNYDPKNNLPAQINLPAFAADPKSCLPLKHMFELAGVSDIAAEINKRKTQSIHALRNLLDKVSAKTTEYIRNIWRDYANVKIELAPNGDNIDASVIDKNIRFEFSKRSDGFRRFITFLLMISAKVEAKTLADTLLLIDEPEIGLHPSGARHLLTELIRISETNPVMLSTHSIFMVDKEKIDRHLLVSKTDEVTKVRGAKSSNIMDEEVIYNAIGFSVFETLAARNIIFEGWKDKTLFQTAVKALPKGETEKRNALNKIGLCHAKGVKDIRHISAFMELAGRSCLVLSDNDRPALERQKAYQKDRGYGTWKRYDEIIAGAAIITSEDFLRPEVFLKRIGPLRKKYAALPELTEADLLAPGGKLQALSNWLVAAGLDKETCKESTESIKDDIFSKLKASEIEPIYKQVIDFVADQEKNWE